MKQNAIILVIEVPFSLTNSFLLQELSRIRNFDMISSQIMVLLLNPVLRLKSLPNSTLLQELGRIKLMTSHPHTNKRKQRIKENNEYCYLINIVTQSSAKTEADA